MMRLLLKIIVIGIFSILFDLLFISTVLVPPARGYFSFPFVFKIAVLCALAAKAFVIWMNWHDYIGWEIMSRPRTKIPLYVQVVEILIFGSSTITILYGLSFLNNISS